MNISIHKPLSIREIGKRLNNQDAIYPDREYADINSKLFLVCDGVGGSNKGEVASFLACDSISTYFRTFSENETEPESPFDPDFIEKAIRYAEIRFDEYIKNNSEAKGMATTLCLLYITQEGIFITHAGDSRIYQFRNGKIIFRTEDHSLINTMVKNGQLDASEAKKHPQKNIIYRAIQGTNTPVDIDILKLTDIQPDDIFLMCTDGVMEALSDEELSDIFQKNTSIDNKIIEIQEACREKSRDNYSAQLISIQAIEKGNVFKQVMTSFLYAFV